MKAIARALKHVEQTPWTPTRRHRGSVLFENGSTTPSERPRLRHFGAYRSPTAIQHDNDFRSHFNTSHAGFGGGPSSLPAPSNLPVSPLLPHSQTGQTRERQPLKSATNPPGPVRNGSYGSFTRSSSPGLGLGQSFPTLDLPGPALDPNNTAYPSSIENEQTKNATTLPANPQIPPNVTRKNSRHGILPGPNNVFRPRVNSNPVASDEGRRPILQRLFSTKSGRDHFISHHVQPEAFVEVRIREAEFFTFLDKELVKIETFYRMKEEEASDRLVTLKSQLHLMHDSRTEELRYKTKRRDAGKNLAETVTSAADKRRTFGSSFMSKPGHSKDSSKGSIQKGTSGLVPRLTVGEESKDYVHRRPVPNVPYQSAKKKLKLALLEFYRGLELLKAYADLNRTAFRKMNKKYDKVTRARPTGRYMSEKVNKAWFVQSDVVENHLVTVEDLYTRYFEKGNRKAAIGKLRGKVYRPQDHSPSAYRNGLTCGAGLVLGIQGLVYAIEHLHSDDDTIRAQTAYLLQVYIPYIPFATIVSIV